MTISDLEYPVLEIDKNDYLGVSIDEDTLNTATSHELKKGFKKNMVIVDSNGNAIKVKDVKFVSGKGRFWGYTNSLDRIIKIDLILEDKPYDMPFEDVKRMIVNNLKKWRHSVDPEYAHEEMQKIQESKDIRELIERFLPHNNMKKHYEELRKPWDIRKWWS